MGLLHFHCYLLVLGVVSVAAGCPYWVTLVLSFLDTIIVPQ